MPAAETFTPELLHKLIQASFEARDTAYAPYSNFFVGASFLKEDGGFITGCNVENASYGAGICAERTAMVKAVSSTPGQNLPKFLAGCVTSLLPDPSCSPCGICRQFMREFLPLSTPILMVGGNYDMKAAQGPAWLGQLAESLNGAAAQQGKTAGEGGKPLVSVPEEGQGLVVVRTLEELLPLSFGPEHLQK